MPKLSITNLTTGPFVLQDPSGVTLFSISVDPGATVVKTVTSDMVQNIESYLVAAAASKQIVYSLQDDATSTADRVPPNVRVVLATPDYMATTDDVLITKLTVAGASSLMLPGPFSMLPNGKMIEVWDGVPDAATNVVSVIQSLHRLSIAAINTTTLGVVVGDQITLASDAVTARAGVYNVTKIISATDVEVLERIPGARTDNGNATVTIKDHSGTVTRLAAVVKSVTTLGDATINATTQSVVNVDGTVMRIVKTTAGWLATTSIAAPAS